MSAHIACGTYRVSETKVYHYAGYECAAWWRDVSVEAGDYPVFGYLEGSVLHFIVTLPGVIVADNFQSFLGGVGFCLFYDEAQHAGEAATYSIHSQDYSVFASMKDGLNSPWTIDLSALPLELDTCSDCKGVIKKHSTVTRCPTCSVERTEKRRQHACRRHRFLLTTGYGLRTTRQSSSLDRVIAEVSFNESPMADFYREILRGEIAAMRTAGPQLRMAARQRYPAPVSALG
jgi:hypothetical protein